MPKLSEVSRRHPSYCDCSESGVYSVWDGFEGSW
jgi:hypothetical protein